MRHLLCTLLLAAVMGCVPYSDNPLPEPNQQAMDASIYGTWFWTGDNESGYIHFGLDRKTRLLRVVMLDFYKDGELKISELSGHTSSVGGKNYLNLKWANPAEENPGYLFVRYEVKEATFGISLMDVDAAEKAITEGILKGEVEKSDLFPSVHITEESNRLQDFVAKHDKELFKETTYLQRLDLPKHQPKADTAADVWR
jgi:hypothetical protein